MYDTSRQFIRDELFLEYPTGVHELMLKLFTVLAQQGHQIPDGLSNGGSKEICLLGITKIPDLSFYEEPPLSTSILPVDTSNDDERYNPPTVVFEVGFSQNRRSLSDDCH